MDLKPASRPAPQPTNVVNPGAPTPPVTEDPFKPDAPVMPPVSSKHHGRGGKGKKFLMVLLMLVLLGGVGYGVYYWQHQQVDKLAKENAALTSQLATANTKISELEADTKEATVTEAPTSDELIITANTKACEAKIDPATKKSLVYTQLETTADKKKVLYNTDKNIALIYSFCDKAAHDPSQQKDAAQAYYKNVGDTWVYITSAPLSTEAAQTYGIVGNFK